MKEESVDNKVYQFVETCISERENFVLNSLIYFEQVKRFESRSDMMKFRCFGDGKCS